MIVGCENVSSLVADLNDQMGTYQKQRKGVKRQAQRVKTQAIKPHLWIFERIKDCGPGKGLIAS